MTLTVEDRLKELGITLASPPRPMANYVGAVQAGSLVFLSGHGPTRPEGGVVTGRLGADLRIEDGYQAARLVVIGLLATLKAEIGDLGRVRRVVKLLGMVNSTPEFREQPAVINGASDLLVEVFGDAGRHARSAVGMAALPNNIAVEVEMIVEVQ